MGLQFILVLCLASVFCLAPLAVYFYWLARITRRHHPLVIAGAWDFVGLLMGLSGLILFGGGLVLSLLQTNFRFWMRGNFARLDEAWHQEWTSWILFASLYLLMVIGLTTLTLLSRKRSLVIYNIDSAAFESVLTEVFEQLNQSVERRGNVWHGSVPLCEVDRFQRGRTITLRWVSGNQLLFDSVDRLIREAVRSLVTYDNPASQWFSAVAFGAGLSAAVSMGLLAYALRLFSA